MKHILIIGPFGEIGGRELEGGFIAKVLRNSHKVRVCSTTFMSDTSQVYDFIDQADGFSVLESVYKSNLTLKILALFAQIKSENKLPSFAYVKNSLAKRFFKVEKKILRIISKELQQADLVFICAQFTSDYVEEIISEAKLLEKPVIFRTTGTIKSYQIELPFLQKIDLFIHHSINNSSLLSKYPFAVIDQTCYEESRLLSLSLPLKKVDKFTFLGRISDEKGILELIRLFMSFSSEGQELNVYGDGPLSSQAQELARSFNRIKFHGYISQDSLTDVFKNTDCLIISSKEESGPLSGLEAMAAGRMILSTRVGAMPERLEGTKNDFWFDLNDENSFITQINRITELSSNQIEEICISMRKRYQSNYTMTSLVNQYALCVDNLFKKKHNLQHIRDIQ